MEVETTWPLHVMVAQVPPVHGWQPLLGAMSHGPHGPTYTNSSKPSTNTPNCGLTSIGSSTPDEPTVQSTCRSKVPAGPPTAGFSSAATIWRSHSCGPWKVFTSRSSLGSNSGSAPGAGSSMTEISSPGWRGTSPKSAVSGGNWHEQPTGPSERHSSAAAMPLTAPWPQPGAHELQLPEMGVVVESVNVSVLL